MISHDARGVLAVGAHPEDIELSCRGTLHDHVPADDRVVMPVFTDGAAGPGTTHLSHAEQESAAGIIGARLRWGMPADGRSRRFVFELRERAASRREVASAVSAGSRPV